MLKFLDKTYNMKIYKKLSLALLLFVTSLIYAQSQPPTPAAGGPPGGGTGGTGTGSQASPIDMYVYVLAIAAVLIIAYFAKKYKTQKI